MGRWSILVLAILLMVAGIFLAIRKEKRISPAEPAAEKSSVSGHPSSDANQGGSVSGGRDRKAAVKSWRHAEEKVEPGDSPPSGDFPVYLGYLQSDGTNRELRIGLRQEAGAELDVADLEIQVNLLDAGGNPLRPETEATTEWVLDKDEFSDSRAPSMRVSSRQRVDGVDLTLRYRGEEVERRRYVLAAPDPEPTPEQGGETD